jgi:hypothetical protein
VPDTVSSVETEPVDVQDDEIDQQEQALLRATKELFEKDDEAIMDLYYKDPVTRESTDETKTYHELKVVLSGDKGLEILKNAVRVNMRYKAAKYDELYVEVGKKREVEMKKVRGKMSKIREAAGVTPSDNWHIFEKVGDVILEIDKQMETFRVIGNKAREILNTDGLDNDGLSPEEKAGSVGARRGRLLKALEGLAYFKQQPMVVETVCEIVKTFLINPYFIQLKFMNFLFAGPAGTGKTSIVRAASKVFSASGIFVYETVVEGGRDNFIAAYEGQTVGKTMNFLISGLDAGVTFVDEAYSITTWDKGTPSSYGSEATSAMVDFMTKYKGLYCLMYAGYEKEMRRYFLAANEGLSRRIPYQFKLKDYTPNALVYIFKISLLRELGIKDQSDQAVRYIETAFELKAWKWFEELVSESSKRQKRVYNSPQFDELTQKYYNREVTILPNYKFMYEIFKDQAGSMSNLAEVVAIELISSMPLTDAYMTKLPPSEYPDPMIIEDYAESSSSDPSTPQSDTASDDLERKRSVMQLVETRKRRFMFRKANTVEFMKNAIRFKIKTGYLSESALFLEEFDNVAKIADDGTEAYFERELLLSRDIPGYVYRKESWYDMDATIDPDDTDVDDSEFEVRPDDPTPLKGKGGGGGGGGTKKVPTVLRFRVSDSPNNRLFGRWLSILNKPLTLKPATRRDAGSSSSNYTNSAWWYGNPTELAEAAKNAFFEKYTLKEHTLKPIKTSEPAYGTLNITNEKDYNKTKEYTRVSQTMMVSVNSTFDVEVRMMHYYDSDLPDDALRNHIYKFSQYQLRLINRHLSDNPMTRFIYSYGYPKDSFVAADRNFYFTRIEHTLNTMSVAGNYEKFKTHFGQVMKELVDMVQADVELLKGLSGFNVPLPKYAPGEEPYGVERKPPLVDDPEPGQ